MFSSSSRQILYSKSEKNRHEIDSFDLEHIRIDKYDGGPIRGVLLFQQRDLNQMNGKSLSGKSYGGGVSSWCQDDGY